MSDSETPSAPPSGGKEPDLLVLTQYVKDLSFENPNAPVIFGQTQSSPKISISVDVRVNAIQDRLAEVVLVLQIEAKVSDKSAFLIELDYAGIANLTREMTPEEAERAFLIDTPAMLFPFARSIVANLSRDGGFMPFLMTPIDFDQLYQQRQSRIAEKAAADPGESEEPSST
ncbi:MAG: protein-export chaperone SecB [Rhodospirillales bacterium]